MVLSTDRVRRKVHVEETVALWFGGGPERLLDALADLAHLQLIDALERR